jgi:serine/threonine-protein phosphatase 6 regulatory subunit 3
VLSFYPELLGLIRERQDGDIPTSLGRLPPLTFERYRICELFAELLHCSNMALLNRPVEYNFLYDEEGRLQGGLSALEDLAQVISMGSGEDTERDGEDGMDEVEPAMELPVHSTSQDTSSLLDSDEDMSDGDAGSCDDDPMEDISISDSPRSGRVRSPSPASSSPTRAAAVDAIPHPSLPETSPTSSPVLTSSPAAPDSGAPVIARVPRRRSSTASNGSSNSTMGRRSRSVASKRDSRRFTAQDSPFHGVLPAGERLKRKLLDSNTLSVVLVRHLDAICKAHL